MKKLINAVDAVVREQLMGMAAAHPELKVRIEPHYITRADAPVTGKVALVSGGGSGHEPALSGCKQGLTVPCRNGKPPLRIQTDCYRPFKHPRLTPRLPTFQHVFPL